MHVCHHCGHRFDQRSSLNQHLRSKRHVVCSRCQQGFASAQELGDHRRMAHGRTAPAPGDGMTLVEPAARLSLNTSTDTELGRQPYDGVPRELVTPVFRAACKLRFSNPTPDAILARTHTSLGPDIVAAILEAALRLLPADDSDAGALLRQQRAADKAAKAAMAESALVDRLRRVDPELLCEQELKARLKAALDAGQTPSCRLTPDAMLSRPTVICGKECNWVEYKNTFGFRSSPYVAAKNKQQFARYASRLGPGMVVFKLGYETKHVEVDGVHCFREAEVLEWLELYSF